VYVEAHVTDTEETANAPICRASVEPAESVHKQPDIFRSLTAPKVICEQLQRERERARETERDRDRENERERGRGRVRGRKRERA